MQKMNIQTQMRYHADTKDVWHGEKQLFLTKTAATAKTVAHSGDTLGCSHENI